MKALAVARVFDSGFFFPQFSHQAPVIYPGAFPLSYSRSSPSQQTLFSVSGPGLKIIPDRRGVTLLELLTVLAIMAVLSGVSGLWLLRGMPERRMMSAARELYCGLRQAQSRAVSQGTMVDVYFDLESDSFSLTDSDGNLISSKSLPGYIDLYKITGGKEDSYFFNSRGIKTGVSGSVHIRYHRSGYARRRVLVTSAGSMLIQRSSDNGQTWK